jgi:putative toxin-antitoxin system antitoxin component (TIGR02293 family)
VQKYEYPTEPAAPNDEWDALKQVKDFGEELNSLATRVLGSQEKADEWLSSPVPALGNRRPIDLCDTPEGRDRVSATLRKIDTGDFS